MQSNQTFSRLQQLSNKLNNYPAPKPPQQTTNINPNDLLKQHQQSSANSITKLKEQIPKMINDLHQIIRITNIQNIQTDNKIDNLKDQISSSYKYQNISTKNNAQYLQSQFKSKQNQFTTSTISHSNQTHSTLSSLKKKGSKLVSNIFSQLQTYKQSTIINPNQLYSSISQLKQSISLQSKQRKQSMIQIQNLINGVQNKLNDKIKILEQSVFFNRLLNDLQKGLQKIL